MIGKHIFYRIPYRLTPHLSLDEVWMIHTPSNDVKYVHLILLKLQHLHVIANTE